MKSFLAAAIALSILLFPISLASQAPKWSPPLTPDGKPDLQGVWLNQSATPLERPKELAGREFLTDEEVAELRSEPRGSSSSTTKAILSRRRQLLSRAAPPIPNKYGTGTSAHQQYHRDDRKDHRQSHIPHRSIPVMGQDSSDDARRVGKIGKNTAAERGRRRATPGRTRRSQQCHALHHLWHATDWQAEHQLRRPDGLLPDPANARLSHPHARSHPRNTRDSARWTPASPAGAHVVERRLPGPVEGNTLVVDTTNFSPKSNFMGSSGSLHLVERFTRVAADMLHYDVTIDDLTTWTKPWTVSIRMKQSQDKLYEYACHEGNYVTMEGILGAARADERALEDGANRSK